MHLPEFALLVIAAITAISAGFAVVASNFRAARALFWISAVSFGSLGIVWSLQSQSYSLGTQMLVSALCAGIAAAGLVWGLNEIKNRIHAEEPPPPAQEKSVTKNSPPIIAGRDVNIGHLGDVITTPPARPFNEGTLSPDNLPTPALPQCVPPTPKDAFFILFGSNVSWATHFPVTVLEMAGDEMITVDRNKETNELFIAVLRIYNSENKIIARIDKDGFWVNPGVRKKWPDKSTLIVFDEQDKEVANIKYLNDRTLMVQGYFRHPRSPVVQIDASRIFYPAKNQSITNSCFGNARVAYSVGAIK
jgi:hypothetical protein